MKRFLCLLLLFGCLSGEEGNAITYSLSNGRLGDNLVAYFHARWLSYKYDLPFVFLPFPQSEEFGLHEEVKEHSYRNRVRIYSENDIQTEPSSTLYECPYFPETRCEYDWCHLYQLPYFDVDWDDPGFKAILRSCLKPKKMVNTVDLPFDAITIAVHIRRGKEGHDPNSGRVWPLKFLPDSFYLEQIRRVIKMYPKSKFYVQIFTDENDKQALVRKYRNELRVTVVCKEGTPLEDFYSMRRFDVCIHGQSNFSVMASKLGNFSVHIYPVHAVMGEYGPVVDELVTKFRPGLLFSHKLGR